MSAARERRRVLLQVLKQGASRSQSELIEALAGAGVPATQPVISRDLRAVGAIKQDGRYLLPEQDRITPLQSLQSLLRGADSAGPNLVVVQCEPGAASAIARALEAEDGLDLVGTVAGDDTVFVAVKDAFAGHAIQQRVLSLC